VRYVAFNPISKAIVQSGSSFRILFFGHPESRPYYLVIEGQWFAPNLNVIAAFKVFADILVSVSDQEPITVLRVLAERFGVPIQIGRYSDTFIISKSFALKDQENRLLKISTEKGRFAQTMHSSFRQQDGQTFLDVSLAYCLNVDKMADYVKSQSDN